MVLDNMVASNQLEVTLREQVFDILMARHKHQNEKRARRDESRIHLPFVRSLAEIGKKYSEPKGMSTQGEACKGANSLTVEGKPVVRWGMPGVRCYPTPLLMSDCLPFSCMAMDRWRSQQAWSGLST
jgi:hypothetical protein